MCTSSRVAVADCGLDRLAAANREGAADTAGLAVAGFFLSFRGLSKDSSTVASVWENKNQNDKDRLHNIR